MVLENCDLVAFVATTKSEQARAFYCDILGLRLVEETPFALVMKTANAILRIQTVEAFEPLPFTAVGWEVAEIRSTIQKLLAKGLKTERFEAILQDELGIWVSPSSARVCWFKDPDGNILSLTEAAPSHASVATSII